MGRRFPKGQGLSEPEPTTPVIVIHSLAHAAGALSAVAEADRGIVLLSAPDAGIYAGPGWFRALADAAREAVPAARAEFILDCGDDPGAVQGAIRAGIAAIVFTGRDDVAERLAAIAASRGFRLLRRRPAAGLDLVRWFFADRETAHRRCADWLASLRPIC